MSVIAIKRDKGSTSTSGGYGLGIYHYGILCPDGEVIHFGGRGTCRVEKITLEQFKRPNTHQVYRVPVEGEDTETEIHLRARKELVKWRRGEADEYSILWNNCEHFARYCATGKGYSEQVEKVRHLWSCAEFLALGGFSLVTPDGIVGPIVGTIGYFGVYSSLKWFTNGWVPLRE